TPMIMQGIAAVHAYEARGLKAALERGAGLTAPAEGRARILADTGWVDAPVELAREELCDPARVPLRAPPSRPGPAAGGLIDGYGRAASLAIAAAPLGAATLVEHDVRDAATGAVQRCPSLLIPAAHAFGAGATGLLLHRLAFVDPDAPPTGRRSALDLV